MTAQAQVVPLHPQQENPVSQRAFPCGAGLAETHALTDANGKPNNHERAGEPYDTLTGNDIARLAINPPSVSKLSANWFIPSSYAEFDARNHEAQRERGSFWWLTLDVDKNNLPLSDVLNAVEAVTGPCSRIAYSTRSATSSDRRWRVLIPLSEPLSGEEYVATQEAYFELLAEASDGVVIADTSMFRPGQIVYLPNRGEYYEHELHKGTRLALTDDHTILRKRSLRQTEREAAQCAARAERDRKAKERAAHAQPGDVTPGEHFNNSHTVEQLLDRYGYLKLGGTDNWRSPLQTSGSFATRCYGDYWVSLSGSDAAAEIGAPTKTGARHGDAFDLFVFFEHGGDFEDAVRSYAQEAGLSRSRPSPKVGSPGQSAPSGGSPGLIETPTGEDQPDVSHDALALELGKSSFDENARHVATWGKWLFWNGARWDVDNTTSHWTRTRDFLRRKAETVVGWADKQSESLADDGNDKAANRLKAWGQEQAHTLRSKVTVVAVETLARSNPASASAPEEFDADLMLLGTPGGTVDLRTGVLREARREDMITKQTAIVPAPAGSRPERWLDFLSEVFDGERELVEFMQRAAGYALTGLTTEHKLMFLYGTGRNGKSTFLDTLNWVLNDYARRAAAETFLNTNGDKHATGLAGLQGARLVVGSELPVGKTWDEAVIKDLTGGDVISARYMRGDFFDFKPQLTLMIAGNNQPSFRGVDEAIRARVVMVPFTVTIPPERRDKDLPDKLRAEGPEILRWAIDGALAWQERGLDVPASVLAASEEYMDDEDVLGQFLADRTVRDPSAFTTSSDLHDNFKFWCEKQGLHPWTQHNMRKELKTRGFEHHRRGNGRGFLGLRMT